MKTEDPIFNQEMIFKAAIKNLVFGLHFLLDCFLDSDVENLVSEVGCPLKAADHFDSSMVLVLFAADSNAQIEVQGLFDVGSLEALVLSVLFLDSLVVLDPMVFELAADYSAVEVLNL